VLGLPDERFGEAVTALVEPVPGAVVDPDELMVHVKAHLAAFKAPKRVITVVTVGRAANGKLDYRRLKDHAAAHAEASDS
jgi:3-oxocholest-4-en-26-oate---CoA ligase